MSPNYRFNTKLIDCFHLDSVHIVMHFPFIHMGRGSQMNEISAFDFLFDLTLQRSNTDGLENVGLRNFLIHGHKRFYGEDPRFIRVLLVINLLVGILCALSLTDSIGKLNIDLTNFGR